jgi:hypothetical protein
MNFAGVQAREAAAVTSMATGGGLAVEDALFHQARCREEDCYLTGCFSVLMTTVLLYIELSVVKSLKTG